MLSSGTERNAVANRVLGGQARVTAKFLLPEVDTGSRAATHAGELAYNVSTQKLVYSDPAGEWQAAGNATTTTVTVDDESVDLPNSRQLVASSSLTLVDNGPGSTLQLVTANAATTLTSAGGTETLVIAGSGTAALSTKGLTAGAGIALSADTAAITITNTSPASGVSLTSAGGAQSLVVGVSGTALSVKGLNAGNSVTLTPSSGDISVGVTHTDVRTDRPFFVDTVDSSHTISAVNIGPGAVYECDFTSGTRTLTLPTVGALLTAYPQLVTGSSYPVYFYNRNSGGNLGFSSNVGWTLAGIISPMTVNTSGVAFIVITDATARTATFYRPR